MLAFGSTAFAKGDNKITIDDITLSNKGNYSALLVNINLTTKNSAKGMKFWIDLPDGVEYVIGSNGKPEFYAGSMFEVTPTLNLDNGTLKVTTASSEAITGSKGLLLAFKIKATGSFTKGQVLTGGKIYNVSASIDDNSVNLPLDEFNITITDCDVVLDENSPFEPEATGEDVCVDVLVKRTINAGQWSTICLPVFIEGNDLKSIFGDGVRLCMFKDYSSGDNFETMSVNFEENDINDGLSFNTPYIIYATKNVSEFVINAEIYPNISEAVTIYKKSGRTKGQFIGSYTADLTIPDKKMFISDNQFYYSRNTTKMKAFRAYFDFADVIKSDPKLNNAVRAMFSIDGETTRIQNVNLVKETGKVYSISGRYMGENVNMKSLPKGVYVVDGVKVINN
jgi:hypothetical protein